MANRELTTLEGWVSLTPTSVVLDFHAQHPHAGQRRIELTQVERVDIIEQRRGLLTRDHWLTITRFDRDGAHDDPAKSRNSMKIDRDDLDTFREFAQAVMEAAATSLAPTASAADKVRSGMYTTSAEGTLTTRGDHDAADPTSAMTCGKFLLAGNQIARGAEAYPLQGVKGKVVARTDVPVDRRTTVTRVVGGASVAGPAGAIVGAVAKKRVGPRRNVRLVISGPGFEWDEEISPVQEGRAREFVAEVNARAARR